MLSNLGIVSGKTINIKHGTTTILNSEQSILTLNNNIIIEPESSTFNKKININADSVIGTDDLNSKSTIKSTATFNKNPKLLAINDGTQDLELASVGYVNKKITDQTVRVTHPVNSMIETLPATSTTGERYIYTGTTTTDAPIYIKNYIYENIQTTTTPEWDEQEPYKGLIIYNIALNDFYTYLGSSWVTLNSAEASMKGYFEIENIITQDIVDRVTDGNYIRKENSKILIKSGEKLYYYTPFSNMIVHLKISDSYLSYQESWLNSEPYYFGWRYFKYIVDKTYTITLNKTSGAAGEIIFYDSENNVINQEFISQQKITFNFYKNMHQTLLTCKDFIVFLPAGTVMFTISNIANGTLQENLRPESLVSTSVILYNDQSIDTIKSQSVLLNFMVEKSGTIRCVLSQSITANATYSTKYNSSNSYEITIPYKSILEEYKSIET